MIRRIDIPCPISTAALQRSIASAWVMLLTSLAWAQPTDLMITEYVEGSGNEKYIELFNGTGAPIALTNYQIRLFSNGSATPSTTSALTGTLAAGAAIVYRNASAGLYGAATPLTAVNFNGDDAIALWKISTAAYVDILGQIGCDPGASWLGVGSSTVDRTLRRKANICTGVTVNPPGGCGTGSFVTLDTEWDAFGVNDVSGLGAHTMTCGPTVNFATPNGSAIESAGTVAVNLTIAPATTVAGTITLTVVNGPGMFYGAGNDQTTVPTVVGSTITIAVPIGATGASFDLIINDDLATEADETVTYTITGATGGIALGTLLSQTFTILDNDAVPTVNFSTLSIVVLENAGVQNFQLGISPAAAVAGTITIQVTNGPGVVYGAANDYFTNPAVAAGTITLNFIAGATTASFSATVMDDALIEVTEQITFTVIGATGGLIIGGNTNATLTIGDNDTPATVLEPGDMVVVGVNANDFACTGGSAGDDVVSFFCFKPIVPGTQMIITDNGYSRCTPGFWGNSEGTVRMTRTGIAIPAGQVITFRITGTSGPTNVTAVAPDAGWTCATLNAPAGFSFPTTIQMSSGGDQLFFMQGGTWNSGTAPGNVNAHNATYTGDVLFAFSTNPSFPWSATCTTASGGNERSDLPPGVQCFSMSPTLATDYNKYIGPITAATQRDWIIRVENTSNWTPYANCNDYNALGYNWMSAPILPIIAGGFTPGLWRGAVSEDWFDCKNWDDAKVPTLVTDILIDHTATRNCVVGQAAGLMPGGTGTCASLLLTSNSGGRTLFLDPGSTLNVGGSFTIDRTAGAAVLYTYLTANTTLNVGDLVLRSSVASQGALYAEPITSTVNVAGNVTIDAGGLLDLQGFGVDGGTLRIGGNYLNLSGEAQMLETNSSVVFNGAGNQVIATGGFEEVFFNLGVNKTGGDLYLSDPIAVRNVLDLSSRRIFSSAAELLTVRGTGSTVNASDASFVHGPMQKIGITDFTFPVGKATSMRPCELSGYTGLVTDAFIAEYFAASPRTTFNDVKEPTLHHISDCEYWMIDRSTGNANATVTLTWDSPESCGVDDLPSLRVARWNGTLWLDRGNGGTTGTNVSGSIPTAAQQNLFSPWTLASVNGLNPLPIELLDLSARPEGDQVRLDWSTASERDNDHFTIERSADGMTFSDLLEVPGSGTTNQVVQYSSMDPWPLRGLSYYRLRQTDFDGTSTLSHMVSVLMDGRSGVVVHGNADVISAVHTFPVGATYEIWDMTARMLLSGRSTMEGSTTIRGSDLPRGAYLFRITAGMRTESIRFVY